MKKILRVVAVCIGVLLAVVVVALMLVNPKKLVAEKKDEILKQVSAKIGRQVTAGDVTGGVGAQLSAKIANVRVEGAPGPNGPAGKPTPGKPQLEIGSLDMKFSLARALFSFGKDLYVERFGVDKLVIRAARDGDGRWDFQDILDKLSADDPNAPPKDPNAKSGAPDFLKGLRIA